MSKSKPSKKNSSTVAKSKRSYTRRSPKPTISAYHLYYALERELLLKQNGIPPHKKYTSSEEWKSYGDLARVFPPRPSRYKDLGLPDNWFLKRKSCARTRHWKNQDAISLQGLSTTIASSWKNCDAEVKGYVTAIAKIIKDRCSKIHESKSTTKSPTLPSTSIELKPGDFFCSKFEPATEDEQKTKDRRVSMNSNTSTISVNDAPYVVHNAGVQQNHHHQQQQQLANLHDISLLLVQLQQQQQRISLLSPQQQMILPYLNVAPYVVHNAAVQQNQQQQLANPDINGKNLCLSETNPSKKSVYAMAPYPEGTQNENTSYPPVVKKHIPERAHQIDSTLMDFFSWLSERDAEATQEYDEEENEDGDIKSFLDQDPNKCGWSQSDYFKNEKSNSGPFTEKIVDCYTPEGVSQQKEGKNAKTNTG